MIKILHTGDIHLDSPFSSLTSRQAEVRRNELRAAFTSMMTYAKMNNTDMIVIAGDCFDAEYVTRETLALLYREFENYKKPVFICTGNHDPATEKSVWMRDIFPDNVHVFKSHEVERVSLPDIPVDVYGFGFTSREMEDVPIRSYTVEDKTRVNVLLCHADMVTGKRGTCCPMTVEDIYSFGADYTALGHIHNPSSLDMGEDCRMSYCGCLEGRSFDEIGAKGACIIQINKIGEDSDVMLKRVRFSKRRYEKGELDITGADSTSAVLRMVSEYISSNRLGDDTLLSLRLTGELSPDVMIDTESIENSGHGLFLLKVEDGTSPELNEESLMHDLSIKGEIYRSLLPKLNSEDTREREVASRALRYAFSALSGENII